MAPPFAEGRRPRTSLLLARVWPAWVACGYFLFCLLVQASTGAWQAGFVAYPDEPSHFVGAVMFRDWLTSGLWLKPFQFAWNYYGHYPFFAVGYWPPAFSVVTGCEFLIAGVGRLQALLVPAAFAAAGAWLIFKLLRRRTGPLIAVCAGALYLSLPAVQTWMCAVMVDHMTAALCLAAGVCLVRDLKQPGYRNGILSGAVCACAIVSKYSATYLVALPWAAILLFRRFRLLREPGFLIQPVTVALLVGPWVLWTRTLAYYGLPSSKPALTAARALSFPAQTLQIFPPVLMAFVILGLLAWLLLPKSWGDDTGVLALLCAGHLAFLFLSPVDPEQRYLLAPAAALLVLSFSGWAAALSRVPGLFPYVRAIPTLAAVLTLAFVMAYFGRYPRPPQYPIRAIVHSILENNHWAGQRIVVPPDLEGPFIAEFVAQDHGRPASYLLRPNKLFAHEDWFGGNYSSSIQAPEQMLQYFRKQPVQLLIWHERPAYLQNSHERILEKMLRTNPLVWRKAGPLASVCDRESPCSWEIYNYSPAPESQQPK